MIDSNGECTIIAGSQETPELGTSWAQHIQLVYSLLEMCGTVSGVETIVWHVVRTCVHMHEMGWLYSVCTENICTAFALNAELTPHQVNHIKSMPSYLGSVSFYTMGWLMLWYDTFNCFCTLDKVPRPAALEWLHMLCTCMHVKLCVAMGVWIVMSLCFWDKMCEGRSDVISSLQIPHFSPPSLFPLHVQDSHCPPCSDSLWH